MREVISLAKMTKAQARKRANEAASKVSRLFMEADAHLTNAQLKTLLDCRNKLLNITKSLK